MKVWVQRVNEASVTIEGECVASIGKGYLVLFSVTHDDTEAMSDKLAQRLVKLRIFEDENGKTNRSIVDVNGSIIVVSQFTLYADTKHGNRPGFSSFRSCRVAKIVQGESRAKEKPKDFHFALPSRSLCYVKIVQGESRAKESKCFFLKCSFAVGQFR